jgi:hypothetical protein
MDITILDINFLRIKGKNASFVVDPETTKSKSKVIGDAVIALKDIQANRFPNIENYRVVIKHPGEYEVNGIMIAGKQSGDGIVYKIILDNVPIVLGKSSNISKVLDKIDSCQVLLLNVDSEVDQNIITSLEPNYAILYGEKSVEGVKNLGKKDAVAVSKFTLAKEKLPEGTTEIVLLG